MMEEMERISMEHLSKVQLSQKQSPPRVDVLVYSIALDRHNFLYIIFSLKLLCYQAFRLLKWDVYLRGIRSLAVIFLQMGSTWLVPDMTRRYYVLYASLAID